MSLHGIRDAERRLAQLEPEEPPEGLLDLLKAEIPAELPVHPELTARDAAEGRSAGWFGRNAWLAAALLVTTLGGGWLALQMWSRSPGLARTAAKAPVSEGAGEMRDAGAGGAPQEAKESEKARVDTALPGAPPSRPAAPSPRVLQPSETEAVAGVEGGGVGSVEGGVVGGVVGGVPGGRVAPEPAPAADELALSSEAPSLGHLRAQQEEEKERAKPAPPAAARAPAPQDDRDAGPLPVGGAREERLRQETDFSESRKLGAGGLSSAPPLGGDLERFDAMPRLAAGGSWRLRVSAVPSPLSPARYWLRVEVRAREGRSTEPVGREAELVVTPASGAVFLRALGGERVGALRQRLAGGGAVAAGERHFAVYGAEPAGASVAVVLRYRETDGEEKEVRETVDFRRAASPEERLLALAAELALARERPERRVLLEIGRLAEELARESRGRPWLPRAVELAGQARREAARAPR